MVTEVTHLLELETEEEVVEAMGLVEGMITEVRQRRLTP